MTSKSRNLKITTCVGVLLTFVTGCSGYGDVSPAAYEYATALYSIANRRSTEAISPTGHQIESAMQNGDISAREARWLQDIVELAENGDWDAAARAARRMMEDQVHRT